MRGKISNFSLRDDATWRGLKELGESIAETLKEPYVPSRQEVENEALWTRMAAEVDTVKKQALRDLWLKKELEFRMSRVPKRRARQF